MKLAALAQTIQAQLIAPTPGAGDLDIIGVASLASAGPNHLTFLTNPRYTRKLLETRAGAVIIGAEQADLKVPQLIHKNPYAAMAKAANLFFEREHSFSGQSSHAFVHPSASVHPSATLYPFAYVDADARVGAGTVLYPEVYVGVGSTVGDQGVLYPGVKIMNGCHVGHRALIHANAVLGADGFGFAPTREGIEKIPQIAGVVVGDDCEIGPGTTIDRGAFEDTKLGNHCKLDSQVHIAHGVEIGDLAMICGQAAIAGSAHIGKRLIMAGHSAIGPSLEIGDNVTLGPKAGITRSTAAAGEYIGMPAVPGNEWRRQVVAFTQIPDLLKTVKTLAKRLDHLEAQHEGSMSREKK